MKIVQSKKNRKKDNKLGKRLLACFFALVLLVGSLPVPVLAAGSEASFADASIEVLAESTEVETAAQGEGEAEAELADQAAASQNESGEASEDIDRPDTDAQSESEAGEEIANPADTLGETKDSLSSESLEVSEASPSTENVETSGDSDLPDDIEAIDEDILLSEAGIEDVVLLPVDAESSADADDIPAAFYREDGSWNDGFLGEGKMEENSQLATAQVAGEDETILLASDLPSSYSSVDAGYVTAVKNQGDYGTCWAFAACAAIESNILKNKLGGYTSDTLDLSEYHLYAALFGREGINDPLGNTLGDYLTGTASDGAGIGNAKNCLMNWSDPALEEDYPYSDMEKSLSAGEYYASQFHVQQVLRYSDTSSRTEAGRIVLKNAILEYGGIVASYTNDSGSMNGSSIFVTGDLATNHAIEIVGWDDDYANTNFKSYGLTQVTAAQCTNKNLVDEDGKYYNYTSSKYMPKYNGAWLIKNSWGSEKGESGYYWISYYDQSLSYFYSISCEPADNYDHNFHYDGGFSDSAINAASGVSVAHVYTNTLSVSQIVSAVGIGVSSTDAEFEVQIYKNPETGSPASGEAMLPEPMACQTTYAGSYTFPLPSDSDVLIEPGDTFSIVFTLKTKADLSVDYSYASGSRTYVSSQSANTVFYNKKAYTKATFRIKAYTNDAGTATANGHTVSYTSDAHGEVTYQKQQVDGKTVVVLSFLPEENYEVSKVIVNGKEMEAVDSLELSDISEDTSIQVEFASAIRKVVVKQKYDITGYFGSIKETITKYKVESVDGGKATVSRKGVLTAKKAGTVRITPVVGSGSAKTELTEKAVDITLIAPVIEQAKMYGTYAGQVVDGDSYFSLDDTRNKVTFTVNQSKNPVISIDSATGDITVLRSGSVKVTAAITNEQGNTVKVSKTFRVKIPKVKSEEVTVKIGKTKTVQLLNVPSQEVSEIKWYTSASSGTGKASDFANISLCKNHCKVKVKGEAQGTFRLTAVVQEQKYVFLVHIVE